MFYAWIEDLNRISGVEDWYCDFVGIYMSGNRVSYNSYFHDYTSVNWSEYL